MDEKKRSLTALITAYARAYHATHDEPKIFDDFLADSFFTDGERLFLAENLAESLKFFDPDYAASCPDNERALAKVMQVQSGPTTLSRARYSEDTLNVAITFEIRQYVILGAGLDTFAFRRQDLMKKLQVFEVDHPATQEYKRQRLDDLGWDKPSHLHFVSVDLTEGGLADALKSAGYDKGILSFFSWPGVTYYLTRDVIFETLRSIADTALAGSVIVFDYLESDAFIPDRVGKRTQRTLEILRRTGEPMITGFDPKTLAADLAKIGLAVREDLSPDEVEKLYFTGRTDDYHAPEHIHLVRVVVT